MPLLPVDYLPCLWNCASDQPVVVVVVVVVVVDVVAV